MTSRYRLRNAAGVLFLSCLYFFSTIPAAAQSEAVPSGPGPQPGSVLPDQGNVTVNFRDVDIRTVLNYLSDVSGIDIVPSPGVEASVTMRLRNQPWETALDIVTRNHGYAYSKEHGIIRVVPRDHIMTEDVVTEVIQLRNLVRGIELVRQQESRGVDDVSVVERQESLEQVLESVRAMIDLERGENATYIPSVNSIVVTAIPSKINSIKNMIAKIDKKIPQVVLDAKVVEIQLNKEERFGVDWNAVISAAGAKRPITFPFTSEGILRFLPGSQRWFYPDTGYAAVNPLTGEPSGLYSRDFDSPFPTVQAVSVDPSEGMGTDLFSFGTLDFSTFRATLELLDERGDAEILSAPRITTLNNQRATIKVVEKIMLQQTVQATQTANLVTVEFESEQSAREVGVKLTVVPHINEDGDITVNLLPEVSTNQGFQVLDVGGGSNAVALTFNSREANTTIRVKDGETIFLGGLIRKNIDVYENKFPILGDILGGVPFIGNAFKYEAERHRRSEVAFFVTVNIVKDALDSVAATQSWDMYDRYILRQEQNKFGDDSIGKDQGALTLKKGVLSSRQETERIEIPLGGSPADKEERKPLLDFRKGR